MNPNNASVKTIKASEVMMGNPTMENAVRKVFLGADASKLEVGFFPGDQTEPHSYRLLC